VPESQRQRNKRWVERVRQEIHPTYEEKRQFTATHPALYLHVWCGFEAVNCNAHVDWLDARGRLVQIQIARASWRPSEVNERLVVEWGRRALAAWLEATLPVPEDPS
jgi:hypothetical protein